MYIFELIYQYLKGKSYHKSVNFNPLEETKEEDLAEECEHFFMPIDSSNETFACKYCGLVVSKDKLNSN